MLREFVVHKIHLFNPKVLVFSVLISTISEKIHQDLKWRNIEFFRMFYVLSVSTSGMSLIQSAPFNNFGNFFIIIYLILALLKNTTKKAAKHTGLCLLHNHNNIQISDSYQMTHTGYMHCLINNIIIASICAAVMILLLIYRTERYRITDIIRPNSTLIFQSLSLTAFVYKHCTRNLFLRVWLVMACLLSRYCFVSNEIKLN